MNIIPVYYVIAIFIMFVALFSLRHEVNFLKSNRVGPFIWTISILNFLTIISLLVVLLIHHTMNQIFVLKIILLLLLLMFAISSVQILTRRRMFGEIQKQLSKNRHDMIRDMMHMIDEKKRDKISKKYNEEAGNPSSNGKKAGD